MELTHTPALRRNGKARLQRTAGGSGYHAKANVFHSDLHASHAESRSLAVIMLPRFVVAASVAVWRISASTTRLL